MCLKHVQTRNTFYFNTLWSDLGLGIFCFILLALLSGVHFSHDSIYGNLACAPNPAIFIACSGEAEKGRSHGIRKCFHARNHTRSFWFLTHFFLLCKDFQHWTDFQTEKLNLHLHCQVLLLLLAVAQESGQAVRSSKNFEIIFTRLLYIYVLYIIVYHRTCFYDYV